MLPDAIDDPDAISAAALTGRYYATLREAIDAVGVDAAVDLAEWSRETVTAVEAGDQPPVTLETATAVLGATDDWPDRDALRLEIRDGIMLSMSSAVLDVDALERRLPLDLDAKEIQQKIEGRRPMTLGEYATLALTIQRENDFA
ncbi:MAG: DUF5791 family protein [Halanaeroarchaeum sp.]